MTTIANILLKLFIGGVFIASGTVLTKDAAKCMKRIPSKDK